MNVGLFDDPQSEISRNAHLIYIYIYIYLNMLTPFFLWQIIGRINTLILKGFLSNKIVDY